MLIARYVIIEKYKDICSKVSGDMWMAAWGPEVDIFLEGNSIGAVLTNTVLASVPITVTNYPTEEFKEEG